MHTRLRHLQSLPGAMLPEPESILNTHIFTVHAEHPGRRGIPEESKICEGTSQRQAQTFHFSALAGASPSMHNLGCSAS